MQIEASIDRHLFPLAQTMAPAAAAMGGGGDTGSGFAGILTKFCLTGTSSMMAEVRTRATCWISLAVTVVSSL